jgi:hypothetical protein
MNAADQDALAAHIEAHAHALTQGLRVMDERRHILQPLVLDDRIREALRRKLDGTSGANAHNHLAPLLAQDLIRELARLLLDEDRRSGSFVNLFRKASVPHIHELMRNRFRRLPEKWHAQPGPIPGLTQELSDQVRVEWMDRDREEFTRSFDEGWNVAQTAVATLRDDPVVEKVKTFRNKHHAHLEMSPLEHDPGPFDVFTLRLTFNDLFELADRYMPPAFELARVLTGHVYDLKDFSDIHRLQGDDMWRILSGLPAPESDQ